MSTRRPSETICEGIAALSGRVDALSERVEQWRQADREALAPQAAVARSILSGSPVALSSESALLWGRAGGIGLGWPVYANSNLSGFR